MCPMVPDPPPGGELAKLDERLAQAVLAGYPLWKTDGHGGSCPRRLIHDFGSHTLKIGARIDFARGTAEDDLTNLGWVRWFERLPRYAGSLRQAPTAGGSGKLQAPSRDGSRSVRRNLCEGTVGFHGVAVVPLLDASVANGSI